MPTDPALPMTTAPMSLDPIHNSRSLAEFATASESSPQRAAMSLDVARHHAFTGEITFFVDPLVRVYLDGGVVYYAEVVGGQSISDLLLAAGVVDARQLDRGAVRVGDVEHLGRLFDRDDTVDRDAATVVVEHHVDQLVNQLAEQAVSRISISAYRHHASGVHRWFVTPLEAPSTSRPVSEVAQVDRSVVEELPSLDRATPEVRIEWTESLESPAPTHQPSPAEVQAELDRFDADVADWAADTPTIEPLDEPIATIEPSASAAAESPAGPLGDFHIVWPDGTQDTGLIADADSPPEIQQVHLDLTPAVVEELPEPDAAIPDDVAAAVKRALQAIDEASAQPIVVPELELSPILLPRIDDQPAPIEAPPVAAPVPDSAPPAQQVQAPSPVPSETPPSAAPMGFAPPTIDTSAEAIYRRQAAEMAATPAAQVDAASAPAGTDAAHVTIEPVAPVEEAPRLPEPRVAEPTAETNERRGALRRLIDGLRGHDKD